MSQGPVWKGAFNKTERKHMATLEMSSIVLAFAGACLESKGIALHETWELFFSLQQFCLPSLATAAQEPHVLSRSFICNSCPSPAFCHFGTLGGFSLCMLSFEEHDDSLGRSGGATGCSTHA
jgi:hypothetical protein